MMISVQVGASETLVTVQTFLFDGGRVLLTASVILFLGYAIFVMSALVISALNAVASGAWKDVKGANASQVRAAGVKRRAVSKHSAAGNRRSISAAGGVRR